MFLPSIYFFLPWLLTVFLYIPVFIQLYSFGWQMAGYSHAFFILPVSLWLVWKKRAALAPVSSSSLIVIILSLFVLGIGLLLYFFGWRHDYLFISTFSLIPVLLGLVLFFYGPHTARELLFPLFYLLLLVPPPIRTPSSTEALITLIALGLVYVYLMPFSLKNKILNKNETE